MLSPVAVQREIHSVRILDSENEIPPAFIVGQSDVIELRVTSANDAPGIYTVSVIYGDGRQEDYLGNHKVHVVKHIVSPDVARGRAIAGQIIS